MIAIYAQNTQKGAAGNDKMILRVRLIGADLPPCGQIPVTE
ncbi:hypothetical protein [Bacteroides ovatus]|nr:hypothetical protein [Bacteroides ovatus]MCS2641328.1 hypothetical protein [Bacteroides ovatus]